jgi:hypothetical protein
MPVYKRVVLNARPPRIAVAFFAGDAWGLTAQRLLEGFSRIWGGAGDVIVPFGETDGIHPALWRVLKRYDADRWAYYAVTEHGRRMAQPEAFNERLDREALRWVEQHGGTIEHAREMFTADHLMRNPQTGEPDHLADQIRRETAPYERRGHLFSIVFMADATPGPHVGLARTPDGGQLRLPAIGDLPVHLQLLVRMRTGDLMPEHRNELTQAGIQVEDTPVAEDDLSTLLSMAWTSYNSDSYGLQRAIAARLTGEAQEAPAIADDGYLLRTPLANTVAGCGTYSVWHPDWDDRPFVVVAGNAADDFALALALDRCFSSAAWLPTGLSDDYGKVVREALARALYDIDHPRRMRLLVTSTSLADNDLAVAATALNAAIWGRDLTLEIVDPAAIPLLPPQRLFEQHRFDREEHLVPFVDGVLAGHLPPVVPSGPDTPAAESLTWQIDVDVEGFTAPTRSCLNEALQHTSSLVDANMRSGSGGPSYMSTRMRFVAGGSTLEQRVARPRLRLPTAIEMVDLLARAAGLTTAPSAAGRFTRGLIELFDGLDECATALRNPTAMAVLDGYQSVAGSGQEPGVYLEAISRRFLTLEDATALAGVDAEQARMIMDQLLERQVLDRGLVLACERCAHAAFYPLAELSRTFTCGRCHTTATIRQERWKKPTAEPYWYYSLDEVAFQALSHDGWDVVHVLTQLRHHTRSWAAPR